MIKKISILLTVLFFISSCSKKTTDEAKCFSESNNSNFAENTRYLWTSQNGEYIRKEIDDADDKIYVYPDVETRIIENKTLTNGNIEEIWYKVLTPNNYPGWLKYNNQYICNDKNPNIVYNEILSDYCAKNNFLITGDTESGYSLFIGNPNCLFEISSLTGLEKYENELDKIYSMYIYTKNAFYFDGTLFPELSNLYIVSQHSDIKNVDKLSSLVLEESESPDLNFLSDCHELQDLFIFSSEEIKLPDMANLENLSTVSILSSKQKAFDGIDTIPCDFNFVFREKNECLDNLIMENVDYSSFLKSKCKAFLIDYDCYQKYLKIDKFVSFITKMKANNDFIVNIVE